MEALLSERGHLRTFEHDFKRYVGAQIGIHNPSGRRSVVFLILETGNTYTYSGDLRRPLASLQVAQGLSLPAIDARHPVVSSDDSRLDRDGLKLIHNRFDTFFRAFVHLCLERIQRLLIIEDSSHFLRFSSNPSALTLLQFKPIIKLKAALATGVDIPPGK